MITLFLKQLADHIKNQRPYKELLKKIVEKQFPCEIEGPKGIYLALLIAKLHQLNHKPSLLVAPTEKEADAVLSDLDHTDSNAKLFPWYGIAPYGEGEPQASVVGQRLNVLDDLINSRNIVAVAPLRGYLTPLPPPSFVKSLSISIEIGIELDPIAAEQHLAKIGYLRVPQVSVHGEFALRGEVLDVFLPGMEEAVRVIFDFEEVEAVRLFNPLTQASSSTIDRITIFPTREIAWTDDRIVSLSQYLKSRKDVPEATWQYVAQLAEGEEFSGESMLFPASFETGSSLLDYMPEDAFVFFLHDEHLASSYESLSKEYRELYIKRRISVDFFVPPVDKLLLDFTSLPYNQHKLVKFPAIKSPQSDTTRITFPYEGPRSFFGNIDYLKEELTRFHDTGYDIKIFADTEAQANRISHLMDDLELEVIPATISHGFLLPDVKIIAIQEDEIFGRRKRRPRSVKTAKSSAIDTFVELNPGDFVVHVNYGIGRFKGIERIKAVGTERDYIQLQYADDETLFIPIEQVNLVQRYIGQQGHAPRLDKIGGKAWESRKSRVRRSVEDLAERLIALYSKRKLAQGFAFPLDTDWQIEFEATFPYEETEDQIRCIEEVKADMEKPEPMDRLVCGDVGYGKTEVAMRAAFKAVTGGKQVAFLAPTTILVEQHYETFVERYSRYPVEIRMISRFVQKSEQKKIIELVKNGEIDILIGTHRLLQKDVGFKNLGLLVVDEEQRFGVKDKERLKELKTSVDCMTLSATPIPRTLHMSLLKLRDMSLLTTPPHNRRPIETYIREFDEGLVAEAIRKEMARGGQVFYLHNRVETLINIRRFIELMVPEAIVEVAHGQMRSTELEDIMHRFIHGGIQVLAATTIIENGIDIPNVNTIIIDRADMYGISQLYQLRGRVGRSDKMAFAYLLYPGERSLSEIAMKRLQIISDHTELGSGFKVALKDLEVRGAGNLLGRQQHGDILSVGFDMYIRLLDEAIRSMDEEETSAPIEVYLELEYSGYIPDRYIEESVEKMEVYKKIAAISSEEELEGVYSELIDRFGPLPDQAQSLMSLAEIRILCRKLGISSMKERSGDVEVEFARVADISVDKAMRLIQESKGTVKPDPKRPNVLKVQVGKIGLAEKSEFLRERLEALV